MLSGSILFMNEGNTTQLQRHLDLLRAGDERARDVLIQRSCQQLERLTRKMFKSYPRLHRWEQTDDVLQDALMRLHRSLAEVQPESVPQFLGLAATQIRRSLIDLSRHHFGPEGHAARHHTDGNATDRNGVVNQEAERTAEPTSLEGWSTFHQCVEKLPEKERETFDLIWYQRLSQSEAANSLGVDLRTIKRRWRSAKEMIRDALDGQSPENGYA
jgi:RNA polymerase sigma-70 factor (ECF subfamily)